MANELTNPALAEELSDIFGAGAEGEAPEGNPDQDQAQESQNEDEDDSLDWQGQKQNDQTSDGGEESPDEEETGARSSDANQNITTADDNSELDIDQALEKLDAAERSSSFWQSKFDKSQQGTDSDFVNQIIQSAKTDPGLYNVLNSYFKNPVRQQDNAAQSGEPPKINPPDIFIPEEIGDPNTESGRYFQTEVLKVAKRLQDHSNQQTDSRLRLLENDYREKGRQTFTEDAKDVDPSLSDGDVEKFVEWMKDPGDIPMSSLVSMWKEASGKSNTAASKKELKSMKHNSSKRKSIAGLGGEGKTPRNPNDQHFLDCFGETAPT